jgi:putative Mg2+ transporter-C (MgtC) family protein
MNVEWELKIVAEVALAMLLGGLIGAEREAARKPAGVRTHMFVCGTAALLVGLGHGLIGDYTREAEAGGTRLQTDPIRIVEAIVTGVSFLGAGTIIRRAHRDTVEGLTTAASLLLCAAIGISVGVERFVIAIAVTALAFFVLRGVKAFEDWVMRRSERDNATTDKE